MAILFFLIFPLLLFPFFLVIVSSVPRRFVLGACRPGWRCALLLTVLFYIRSRVTRHSLYLASSLDSGIGFTFGSCVWSIIKQVIRLLILPWSAGYVEPTREAMD